MSTAVVPEPGRAALRSARRQGVMIGIATGAYGISFGALSVAAGLDVWQTMVLSALLFSGGSQFAFVGVVSAGGALGGAVATATLLGMRNLLYGLPLSQLLRPTGPRRLLAAHLTIDESSATSAAQPDTASRVAGFWWAGAQVYLWWNLLTLAGALAGDALGDPARWGLDAAAAAAFLGLLWPRLRARHMPAIAVASAFVALLLTPVLPAGLPILATVLVAVAAGWREPRR